MNKNVRRKSAFNDEKTLKEKVAYNGKIVRTKFVQNTSSKMKHLKPGFINASLKIMSDFFYFSKKINSAI